MVNNLLADSSGNNIAAIIFLGFFFIIIILLIVVAFVGSIRDKREKLVTNSKNKKLYDGAFGDRVIIFVSLNKLIGDLQKELDDFKPSIGLKSLGQINKEYGDQVKALSKSKELKNVFQSQDFKLELSEAIQSLLKTKPSNWTKKASFAVNIISQKSKSLKSDSNNKSLVNDGEKKKWN